MIASHVLIVLLSLLLTYVFIFGALYDLVPKEILGEEAFLDYAIGERSRAVAYRVDPSLVQDVASGGNAVALNARLQSLLPPESPEAAMGQPAAAWLSSIENAAVVALDGRILASTSTDWATPGQQISTASPLVSNVTLPAMAMYGNVAPGLDDFSYGIGNEKTVTAASHPIISDAGDVVGYVTVQSVPANIRDAGSFWEVVRFVYETQRQTLLIVVVSSLAIAIPPRYVADPVRIRPVETTRHRGGGSLARGPGAQGTSSRRGRDCQGERAIQRYERSTSRGG